MPRQSNPYIQYTDGAGNPYTGGLLYIYVNGTNVFKDVFADQEENTPIANPVPLNSDGSVPNLFYSGSARWVLHDVNSVQIFDRDNVGGQSDVGNFSPWDNLIIYNEGEIVLLDGKYYVSKQNGNQGNNPSSNPGSNSFWDEIRFIKIWNSSTVYSVGDIVQVTDGITYRSVSPSNTNNDPAVDDGSNWQPTVQDNLKYPLLADGSTAKSRFTPDNSAGACSYTMPTAPSDGDSIQWVATSTLFSTNTMTFTVTDKDIQGDATSLVVDSDGFGGVLVFSSSADEWKVFENSKGVV